MPPTSTPRRHASSSLMVSRLQKFDIDFRFEHIALLESTIRYLVIKVDDAFSISEQGELRTAGAALPSDWAATTRAGYGRRCPRAGVSAGKCAVE